MCGLVAIISKNKMGFVFKDKAILLQMLIADMFRGMDSTGLFAVNKHGNVQTVKDASPASRFINKPEATKFIDKIVNEFHIVVGHNRKATMGGVTDVTAHPFIEGNTVLVHNGTLSNHRTFSDKTVDSNAICEHINNNGYKETLKTIEGAYALIWYNAETKTLFFSRNADRPLHLVETSDKIYLASEAKMLDWILNRNDLGKYTVQNVPTDKVFKFNLDSRKLECESKPKKEVVSHKQTQSRTQQQQQSQMGYGNLALAYSSAHTAGSKQNTASIESYKAGETVSWRITDFDLGEKSCKLLGETCDGLETDVVMFLDLKQYAQSAIDKYINAEFLRGKISSITQKKGVVHLYMASIASDDNYIDRNGQVIPKGKFIHSGECCYSCGTVLATEADVADSDVSLNLKGNIMYVLCGQCCNQSPFQQGAFC